MLRFLATISSLTQYVPTTFSKLYRSIRSISPKHILLCTHVFFWPIGIFFSSDRGSFLVLSALWYAGSPPGPRGQVWALAEVRGTCSGGFKS